MSFFDSSDDDISEDENSGDENKRNRNDGMKSYEIKKSSRKHFKKTLMKVNINHHRRLKFDE